MKVRSINVFGKEYLSDDIYNVIFDFVKKIESGVIVSPPGGGKTFAISKFIIEYFYKRAMREEMEILPEVHAFYVFEPTHKALENVATEIEKRWHEYYGTKGFALTTPPRIVLLRGSPYSCILQHEISELKKLIDYYHDTLRKYVGGAHIGVLLNYCSASGNVTLCMQKLNIKSLDKFEQTLLEASFLNEFEYSYSIICKFCKYNPSNNREGFTKLIENFYNIYAKHYIIDTRSDLALQDPAYQLYQLCPYRTFLRIFLYEPQVRYAIAVEESRGYVICTSHAILTHPEISQLLEMKYAIVTRTAKKYKEKRLVHHCSFIDECDYPLFTAPFLKIPIHLSPRIQLLTVYDIVNSISKEVSSEKIYDLKKLLQAITNLLDEYEQARKSKNIVAIYKFIKNAIDLFTRIDTNTLNRAKSLIDYFSAKVTKKYIASQDFNTLFKYLLIASICNKVIEFIRYIKRWQLNRLNLVQLLKRIYMPYMEDVLLQRFQYFADFERDITFITTSAMLLKPFEHALSIMFDPYYPYVHIKIGLTATFSITWISKGIFSELIPVHVMNYILQNVNLVNIVTAYTGLKIYRAYSWVLGNVYENVVKTLFENPYNISKEIDRYIVDIIAFEQTGTKKELLTKSSGKYLQYPFSIDLLLNLIHELWYIAKKEFQDKAGLKIFVLFATRSQFETFVLNILPVLKRTRVFRHGLLKYVKIREYGIETERRDMFKIVVEVQDVFNEIRMFEIQFTYTRSRYGRAINLDIFDIGYILSPPIEPIASGFRIAKLTEGISPLEQRFPFLQASISILQAIFRIVRRLKYEKKKVIVLDETIMSRKTYVDLFPEWFKYVLTIVDYTPIAGICNRRIIPIRF